MPAKPVHMVGDKPDKLPLHANATTRCGLIGAAMATSFGHYDCVSESGGEFTATTRKDLTTCRKCNNLITIGMIHRRPK